MKRLVWVMFPFSIIFHIPEAPEKHSFLKIELIAYMEMFISSFLWGCHTNCALWNGVKHAWIRARKPSFICNYVLWQRLRGARERAERGERRERQRARADLAGSARAVLSSLRVLSRLSLAFSQMTSIPRVPEVIIPHSVGRSRSSFG